MNTRVAIALMAAGLSLAACSTYTNVSSYGPGDRLLPRVADVDEKLPPEAYLDGTGPVSSRLAARPAPRQAQPVRSASAPPAQPKTDGVSSASKNSDLAAFTPEWWERENREDQRLRNKMNICRGC